MRLIFILLSGLIFADDENTNGNNQTADNFGTNNNNSTVSSYNEATTNNYSGAGSSPGSMPVGSAVAPSLMSSGMDSCLMSASNGLQLFTLGASTGKYYQDEECNRRRDAKVLKDLGMSVAAVARMCESQETFDAMFVSGTPCPVLVNGKLVVGRAAYLAMKQNPETYIMGYGRVKSKNAEIGYKCIRNRITQRIIRCDTKPSREIDVKYSTKQLWYNTILGIGKKNEETTSNNLTISEQFRSSIQSGN